jgi:outer membrane receptor protein involved in Fe transport
MRPIGRAVRFGAAAVALLVGTNEILAGQGVTSAAVQGRVTSETRGHVQSAIVVLTNTTTGARQQATTNAAGRYNFENVTPGGPFTVDVRAIGFQPANKTGIMLTLGQRYTQDFELTQQVVTLEELTVISATNPLINSGRTGPAQIVSDTSIQRLPLLGRNFISLLNTSPQVVPTQGGGLSIAGQNNRFNTILIDGGVNNDIFGLAANGTPGGQANAKPISIEALQEFQVLVAPFDIRQGSFSGGLVNGITKSGSNSFHGSLFGYIQRPELVGVDTTKPIGVKVTDFQIKQYGGTFGGPIIRNRLHFFGSADIQSSTTEFFGAEVTEPATGITAATALRVQDILKTQYGFDPGGIDKPVLDRPDKNLFGKLTLQMGGSSQLEVSHNYVKAADDNFLRGTNLSSRNRVDRDGWMLSNSGYFFQSITNSTRAKYTSLMGGANIEVLLGYQTVRDGREIPNRVPLILVQGDAPNNYIAAGGEKFSQANTLDQDNIEATANVTFGLGRNHQITVGTHNEFFKFNNVFFAGSLGVWTFGSVDSLDLAEPNRYELSIETRPGGATADFNVKQFGGYLQDAWRPNDRLTLTAGLRFDVPTSPAPVENELPALISPDTLGVHTGQFPSGNVLISPRLGFNWDPMGNGNTIVRGGVGIFSGRPPYVWLSNAFTNTGKEQVVLICTGPASTPTFTVDPASLPQACATGGPPTPPAANVNYFDKDFKFQQALKYSLGLDHRLPWGMVGTLDFLYTAAKNQMYQVDDNVRLGSVNGEGRQLYATPNAAGTALTRLTKTSSVRQVVRHENRSADKAYNFTAQLQKQFSNGVSFSGAYTYSNAKDLITLTSSIATSNLANTSLDGTLENRNLRTSGLDVPHKITLSGSADLFFGVQGSIIYNGRSGTPYTYTVTGDANGDAITVNDIMYVPRDANDISLPAATATADWDRLNAYIASEPCLFQQRGRMMERNTCRNPWVSFVNVRLGKVIPTRSGQSLEVSADVFNLLNLVDRDWGLTREHQGFEERPLLAFVGYDTRGTPSQADDRGRYTVPALSALPPLNRVQVGSSRWRIQLGGKYTF